MRDAILSVMVTIFIKVASMLASGDIVLTCMVKKGILKDSMKAAVEGKTITIAKMGSRGANVTLNTIIEAKEGSIFQMKVLGADYPTLKKYEGKQVEFQ